MRRRARRLPEVQGPRETLLPPGQGRVAVGLCVRVSVWCRCGKTPAASTRMAGRGRAGSWWLHSQASRLEPKFVALGVRATLVGHPGLGRPGEEAGALRAARPLARGWSDARVEAGPAQSGLLFGGPAPTLHGWPCAGRTVSLVRASLGREPLSSCQALSRTPVLPQLLRQPLPWPESTAGFLPPAVASLPRAGSGKDFSHKQPGPSALRLPGCHQPQLPPSSVIPSMGPARTLVASDPPLYVSWQQTPGVLSVGFPDELRAAGATPSEEGPAVPGALQSGVDSGQI
ncbi:uncharacterized protein LOC125176426 isoform X2 [Prionailurus viverrinus]|uniref:uncharacterized protein LOC125176426 isoform X2 n=1 Tax=Prionailurus viverrinus TaxID=61388 RepID=UPI001FF41E87|nr:uncharacterized protein LOC125176426 isoform X2 [Prionailurus viverrinus]